MAATPDATVTESINDVHHGPSQSTQSYPAKVGTLIHDGEYLKTGDSSRAELELALQAIARLGENTIFDYSAEDSAIDLQAGTILFTKPKDGKQLNIRTAAVTAAIVGTTGFAQVHHHNFLIGIIEGKAKVAAAGKHYVVEAGEILLLTPGSPPRVFAFDVPRMLKTSRLINGFRRPLPNQKYIDKEVADYQDDLDRGFLQPPKHPFFAIDYLDEVPTVPLIAHDSQGNALDDYSSNQSSSNGP